MIHSGFFNSKNHDRKYPNSDISRLLNALVKDGVFQNVGKSFFSIAGTGMQVLVQPGMAYFNSTWIYNDADYPVTIGEAPTISGYSRIDGIFLKMYPEDNLNTRENSIHYMAGTSGSSPSYPKPISVDGEKYIPLCYVRVGTNVNQIDATAIENQIGRSTCPFISGILNTIDANQLLTQWDAIFNEFMASNTNSFSTFMSDTEDTFRTFLTDADTVYNQLIQEKTDAFSTWFSNLQYVLDGDVAGHLQNEIEAIPVTMANDALIQPEEFDDATDKEPTSSDDNTGDNTGGNTDGNTGTNAGDNTTDNEDPGELVVEEPGGEQPVLNG